MGALNCFGAEFFSSSLPSKNLKIKTLLLLLLLLLLSVALQPSAGYGLLVIRGFLMIHNDAPESVELLLDE
jgi:hypothetical protein